eukprot:gnl/Dysnectes_brevis/3271_a4096_1155.p1 GENE.gnl/Dysnectes_brevis/3271_a4096_1155~~gnl/Dysnectes_brevis/3271_a4096_1155.p1  ORF type:complete len:362 (+),score=20.19 gnl/Dysnectes_brevis/3271_a4096_1155:25-1110(+)
MSSQCIDATMQQGQGPKDTVSSIQWSTPTTFFAGSWDGSVSCFQLNTQATPSLNFVRSIQAPTPKPILAIAAQPQQPSMLAASLDEIFMMDFTTGQSRKIAQHQAPIYNIKLVSERNLLFAGSLDNKLVAWDIRSGSTTPSIIVDTSSMGKVTGFDIGGPHLGVVGFKNKSPFLGIYDPANPSRPLEQPLQLDSQSPASSLTMSSDGLLFHAAHEDGRITVTRNTILQAPMFPKTKSTSSNSKSYRFVGAQLSAKKIYRVTATDWHSSGVLAVCTSFGSVITYRTSQKKKINPLFGPTPSSGYSSVKPQDPITAFKFSPDGTLAAFATGEDWSEGRHRKTPPIPKIKLRRLFPDTASQSVK